MDGLRSVLQAATLGDVPVDLQHRCGVPQHIADQHLATFDDHQAAIAAGMRQFPFPASIPFEVRINISKAGGKTRLEQAMAETTKRLLGRPAVEFLRSLIPEDHTVHGIADEDRIVRQVDELSLQVGGAQLVARARVRRAAVRSYHEWPRWPGARHPAARGAN